MVRRLTVILDKQKQARAEGHGDSLISDARDLRARANKLLEKARRLEAIGKVMKRKEGA